MFFLTKIQNSFLEILLISILVFICIFYFSCRAFTGGYTKKSGRLVYITRLKGLGSRQTIYLENPDEKTFVKLKHGFARDKNKAYLYGATIPKSHGASFEVLKNRYAKDQNYAYYQSKILSRDSSHFEVISYGDFLKYAKDSKHVYYQDQILEGADPKTFEKAYSFYFKDQNFGYYRGSRIKGSHGLSFVAFDKLYAKDQNHVYYKDKMILEADPESFEIINQDYSFDKKQVYKNNQIVEGSHPQTFEILKNGYARDKKHGYFLGKIISQDGKNFELVMYKNRVFYAKDSHKVYRSFRVLENSDAKTFAVLSEFYAKDQKNVWYGTKRLDNLINIESFQPLSRYYSKTNSQVFYKDKEIVQAHAESFKKCKKQQGNYWFDKNAIYSGGKRLHDPDGLRRKKCE